jgi:hypothetical protein
MAARDLIPWNRGRDVTVRRGEEPNPFVALHREVNRLFDDVFRDFDLMPFRSDRFFHRAIGWPNIEVSENDKEAKSPPRYQVLTRRILKSNSPTTRLSSRVRRGPRQRTRIGCSVSATMGDSNGGSQSRKWTRIRCLPHLRTGS